MKYIYVLEDDGKLQKQIYDALRTTDPQSQIRFFNSLEDFHKWMAIALKEGQHALFKGGAKHESDPSQITASGDATDELILLISKDEWFGSRYVALIKKTIESFVRKQICTKEDPTRMVITAFESPDFNFHLVEDPIISNVIFKPFDVLMLQQHLHFALKGHHAPSQSFVHKVQTAQEVEMTKEVQMEAVGDVGFVTRSPREIKVGQISKYYGDVFKSTGRTHVMGRCIACEPHPELPGQFRVWFSFFGIPSWQISDIRRNMVKRNEIEYSANSPFKPQQLQLEWIILDAHKDRVTKTKKILETVAEAQVKVISSFDAFIFQTDPVALEGSRKENPWEDSDRITLHLDLRGDAVLKVMPEDHEQKKIFGEAFSEFKKKGLHSRVLESSLATFKSWFTNGSTNNEMIVIHNAGQYFTVKGGELHKKTNGPLTYFELELIDPSSVEKSNWMQSQFQTPHKAHAILIADEYVHEERLAFWEEFVRIAQSKGGAPRFFLLSRQAQDEKMTRKLNWVEDIFEDSNDSAYIERKLRWRGGLQGSSGEHTIFLNSCQELIRVANPVEIAELSEAAVILNYYRPIEVGAFRKFVLSSTAETFQEYRGCCNYSTEHPTEKGMFQAHFVFFGITDSYLKSIRLWILENYVQSKKEEGA